MKKIFLLPLIFILNVSCSTADSIKNFENKTFQLDYSNPPTSSLDNITVNLNQGHIGGKSACNSYMGSYKLDNNNIKIGPLATTKMYCSDRMDDESIILDNLNKTNRIDYKDNTLNFFRDDELLLRFKNKKSFLF